MPTRPNPPGLVIKRHNIRIWCHECDMGKLQRVVWEGQGARLLSEVSSQPVVKKFLEAVPYIMNTIRDIHNAVIQNDLEGLIKLTGEPVPPHALSCRDSNNMTPMHKAAGLGHGGILKYIIERYPQGIKDVDNDGRTPLHYAALVKDDQHTYNTLLGSGADESAVDNKNKTPGYYINKSHDIDKNIFKTLPDAPRTPSNSYPPSWDWKILESDYTADINKKFKKKNHRTSNENISSKNNTNTISESIETNNGVMKNSSTQELISTFPDLNENEKAEPETTETNENTTHIQEDTRIDEDNEIKKEVSNNEESSETENQDEQDQNNSKIIENDDGNNEENLNDEDHNKEGEINDVVLNSNSDVNITNEKSEQDQKENNIVDFNNTQKEVVKDTQNIDDADDENIKDHHNIQEENDKNKNIEDIDDKDDKDVNVDMDNKDKEEVVENNDIPDSLELNMNESKVNNDLEENVLGNDSQEDKSDNHNEDISKETNDIINEDLIVGRASSNTSNKEGNPVSGRNIQESLIEGLISSEAEQETEDASISQRESSVHNDILIVDNEIDPEVTDLINTANMEMLATLVLNGEGARLIGRHSGNLELQAFLNNVPTYMQKINRVHIAAREGNIRDLQAALDRRKFAIARDPISPNGATPLHVAVVFGKTNIIKYLGGRFPETLSAVDFEGRTALHYAAVLPDNGHYFNLLQQLGANSKDLDDMGRSAEDYYKNPTLLTFKQLLADFGVSEEVAQEMFTDKDISTTANGHMDIPIFQTEEGRYLAKSLGDPLIKGLTEVANIKPKDPVAFLATFLHNFPEHEKPRPETQESNVLVTKEAAEFENEHPPYADEMEDDNEDPSVIREQDRYRTATKPRPIDVITVDPQTETSPDAPEIASSSANRDEHGQSMLHFAAARTHTNNALFQLLQESEVSLGYRDELYRTARDVSIQANVLENTVEIDRWVLSLAARGKTDKIMELLIQGYDHILDIVDEEGVPMLEVVGQRGDDSMNNLLASIPPFEESRESLHGAVRRGDMNAVREIISGDRGHTLARAHNALGRTSLHVAVLAQHEDVVDYLSETCPELLRVGDNLERTPLHYAMGMEKMESLSRILIKAGAKRVLKDLKGRQPSYYFMNKSDILRLKEEEEAY
ncbi:uncharacterized protein LOC116770226 [Danaus plexippus]|uniref:uncharacterized protein LOC116770226 n=1 Tax=Danaus plexippus TaxID=13037 RepID=UPI002AB03C5B|nr:uncharacterized protein LOC116770226 [Danaus plexippus]